MKNKTYIFTALALTLGISFSVALAGSKDVLPSITFGDNDPYTLTISSFDSENLDPSVSDNIYIASTASGNPVKFAIDSGAYGGTLIDGGSLYIGKGGYIRNHTEILGIREVTVNYDILNSGSTLARCELGDSPVDFTTSFVSDSNDLKITSGEKKSFASYKNFMQFMCPDDVPGMEESLVYKINSISIIYNCPQNDLTSQFDLTYDNEHDVYNISINPNVNKASLTSIAVPATYLGKDVIAEQGFLSGCTGLTSITFEKFPISSVGDAGNVPLLYYFTTEPLPTEAATQSEYDFMLLEAYKKYDHDECASLFRGLVKNLANIRVLSGSVGSYVFYGVCSQNNNVVEIGKDVLTVGAFAFEMQAESGTDKLLFHQGGPNGIETHAFCNINWSSIILNNSISSIKAAAFFSSSSNVNPISVPYTEGNLPVGWENGWNASHAITYRS